MSNVSLSDLSRRSVKLLPKTEQRITASHLFTTIQTNNLSVGLLNSLLINDVGIDHITNSVLLRDIEQNISNHVIFQNLVASSNSNLYIRELKSIIAVLLCCRYFNHWNAEWCECKYIYDAN